LLFRNFLYLIRVNPESAEGECSWKKERLELLENEYLNGKRREKGHILACMSIAKSKKIKLNFDLS
jgi:ring-1,2-phenylacetyl-CoA epoxidase subunit PaaE